MRRHGPMMRWNRHRHQGVLRAWPSTNSRPRTSPIRSRAGRHEEVRDRGPWPALWALVLGFFMILVDSTIVSIATPAIIRDLDADVNSVIWVTSAYLLAYAVPLLVTGRLGDRFGPKYVYLVGLALFTAASLWCGLTGSITVLVVARVRPGPRRIPDDPADDGRHHPHVPGRPARAGHVALGRHGGRRHARRPAGGWPARRRSRLGVDLLHQRADRPRRPRAGVAAGPPAGDPQPLVRPDRRGPVLGRDVLSRLRHPGGRDLRLGNDHRVPLGAAAHRRWAGRAGSLRVVAEPRADEPLVPLSLFRDRNFSLSNAAITTVGFAITAMAFPFMLFTQAVLGYSPTKSALLLVPVAVFSGALAPSSAGSSTRSTRATSRPAGCSSARSPCSG